MGFYVALLILRGLSFLISHVPPSTLPLDSIVLGLTYLEHAMLFPRWLLRHLWFSETTPTALIWTLSFLNNAVWGIMYAAFKIWREPERIEAPQPPVIG
jgi:hypothetical protein